MRKNYKKQQILIVLILILCFIAITSTFSRYVLNSINNFFVRTKDFYFFSDKLKEQRAVYQIDNWSGVDPYTITINMNSMENSLKKVDYDVDYQIEYICTSNATCQISKTEGTIKSDTNTDFFNVVITPNTTMDTGDRVTVSIKAISNSKYKKTLEGLFTLVVGKEQLSYEIVDSAQSQYLDLNITNTLSYYKVQEAFGTYKVDDKIDIDTYLALEDADKSKCYSALITLKFDPNIVLLDMTNTNYLNATNVTTKEINGSNYLNSLTFKVEPISSTVVRFYKVDITQDYTYPITNATSIISVEIN